MAEYIECFWHLLKPDIRYKVIFLSDMTHSSFPLLHFEKVEQWLLFQIQDAISKKDDRIKENILIELISCIINQKVTRMNSIEDKNDNIETLMSHFTACHQRVLTWCESELGKWNYNLLLLALLLLSDASVYGGSYCIIVADQDDSQGADILLLDGGSGHASMAEIPLDALLYTLARFLTPRNEFVISSSESKLDNLRYVDFDIVLKSCHQLGNAYMAGILLNNLKLTLVGIMKSLGLTWSVEKCWKVLTQDNFVASYTDEYQHVKSLQVLQQRKSVSRLHLHLLYLLYSHENNIDELKLIFKTCMLLKMQSLIRLETLDSSNIGPLLLRMWIYEDEFADFIFTSEIFPLPALLALAQRCLGCTKCLPPSIVSDLINMTAHNTRLEVDINE